MYCVCVCVCLQRLNRESDWHQCWEAEGSLSYTYKTSLQRAFNVLRGAAYLR